VSNFKREEEKQFSYAMTGVNTFFSSRMLIIAHQCKDGCDKSFLTQVLQ